MKPILVTFTGAALHQQAAARADIHTDKAEPPASFFGSDLSSSHSCEQTRTSSSPFIHHLSLSPLVLQMHPELTFFHLGLQDRSYPPPLSRIRIKS